MSELSPKHRAFVNEYLDCFNATEAYMRVYAPKQRTTAEVNGSRLLGNAKVTEAVEARLKERTLSVDEALALLSEFATGRITDVFEYYDGIKEPYIRITPENSKAVKKFKRDALGKVEIEMEDRQGAIDKLLRARGAYVDRHEISGADGSDLVIRVKYAD